MKSSPLPYSGGSGSVHNNHATCPSRIIDSDTTYYERIREQENRAAKFDGPAHMHGNTITNLMHGFMCLITWPSFCHLQPK